MDPLILIVNGLPGSGKTTIARALAARRDRAAVLEGDYLQHTVTVSGLVGPDEEPAAESLRQLELRWRNLAALARNFADEGFDVLVDSLTTPPLLVGFQRRVAPHRVGYLHLDPDRSVGFARDASRGSKTIGDRYDFVAAQFDALRPLGVWIDSTHQSVEQTVHAALDAWISGRLLLA